MPLKSKSQNRYLRWAESAGKLPKGTAHRWAEHTPGSIKKLPEHAKKAYFDPQTIADSLALSSGVANQGDAQILAALQRTPHAPTLSATQLLTAELSQDDDPDELQSPTAVDASSGVSGLSAQLMGKDAGFLEFVRQKVAETLLTAKRETPPPDDRSGADELLHRIVGA